MRSALFFRRALIFSVLINVYIAHIQALASPSGNTGGTKTRRQIDFSGSSSHQILVPRSGLYNVSNSSAITSKRRSHSLPKWLASRHSHRHLLGSDEVSKTGDGTYKAVLPSISWFGMELVPTFFQRISIRGEENDEDNNDTDTVVVKVSIEDSEVNAQKNSRMSGLVEKMMKTCSFQGSNEVKCTRVDGHDGEKQWMLTSDFTLNLQVPLGSRLMILPPGFNTIGSRIVKSTVEKRVKENLLKLAEGYHEFNDGDAN